MAMSLPRPPDFNDPEACRRYVERREAEAKAKSKPADAYKLARWALIASWFIK